MKFLDFLDNSLQETRKKEADAKGVLIPTLNGKLEGLRFLLFVYVGSFKWLSIPWIFLSYLLVCFGLKAAPRPVLKFEQDAKKEAAAFAAKIKAEQAAKSNGSEKLSGKKEDLTTEAGEFPPLESSKPSNS